jgi:predicted TIM-barrel fold metal-dependent hydrolase
MNRRTFLGVAAGMTLADAGAQTPSSMPVIDTHIHLFDTSRPQGVPWPNKNNPDHKVMYMPSLPSRYRPIAEPLGVVGAIEIECSSWLEDNQWVLDVARDNDIMVGSVGHLTPGTPEFRPNLERFHKNPIFRGVRYGLGRATQEVERPEFVADLKALADADLVLDTANPSVPLLEGVVRVSDRVPNLRIVVDHLPQMPRPTESAPQASYDASMKAIRERPQIYVKVSEVLRKVDGKIPTDLAFYRPRLDEVLDVFGIDRVLYGSDWPNGDQWLPVPVGFKIVQEYFMGKGRAAAEKYFWRNSIQAYKWVKRTASQPRA